MSKELPPQIIDIRSQAVKRSVFNGKRGRVLTDEEVNEILDFIVMYGYCPSGLSRRMELYYMKHPRLEERRKRIARERRSQTGKHRTAKTDRPPSNIVPYKRRKASND